ncbi:YsnF/AvaK domain-containing protein [Granulicella arctica]|uniref:YsnF/AvaK domain-containing protein n=1 Tax=Granulicella arctica TaxID=940613 RepID=UPI0021DFE872|nr:YsnF/AvaK domain-containing protein [Granulicella arctica]
MALNEDLTTLLCLFHHSNQADAALTDLLKAGVPQGSISRIDNHGSEEIAASSLKELGIPARDEQHLLEGLRNGGIIVAVKAVTSHVSAVEHVFGDHKAGKIDEAVVDNTLATRTAVAATGETAIPIVDEELVVGKRTVDQGGVRVYRRVIDIPVEKSVNLREEHVVIDRRPVVRAVTAEDLALQGEQTIELTETAEEAVITKKAFVVEEVRVGKEASERTEHIQDTVRHTEVELEEINPEEARSASLTNR